MHKSRLGKISVDTVITIMMALTHERLHYYVLRTVIEESMRTFSGLVMTTTTTLVREFDDIHIMQ